MNAKIETSPIEAHELTLRSIASQLLTLGRRVNSCNEFDFSDQEQALTDVLDQLESARTRLLSARDTAAELAEGGR